MCFGNLHIGPVAMNSFSQSHPLLVTQTKVNFQGLYCFVGHIKPDLEHNRINDINIMHWQ